MSGGVGPSGVVPAQGAVVAAVPAAQAGQAAVQLQVGQVVRATIANLLPDTGVLLDFLGTRVRATTDLPLLAGRTYEFVVTKLAPTLTLSPTRPLATPGLAGGVRAGLLGPSGRDLGQVLQAVLPARSGPPNPGSGVAEAAQALERPGLARLVELLGSGQARGLDLQAFTRQLGHDQEARVLRLPNRSGAAALEVGSLQQTIKAEALLSLAAETASDRIDRPAVRAVVDTLNGIEVENAHRAEQGKPQWLPLAVVDGDSLKDARMFVVPPPEEERDRDGRRSDEASFSVVLLLDFTRLGQVRVDVEVRGGSVGATFQLAHPPALAELHQASGALRSMLEGEGLTVGALRMRLAPGGELPVADLLAAGPRGSSDSLVDVHA